MNRLSTAETKRNLNNLEGPAGILSPQNRIIEESFVSGSETSSLSESNIINHNSSSLMFEPKAKSKYIIVIFEYFKLL